MMAYEALLELLDHVRKIRGETVRLAIAFANCFGGWTFGEAQLHKLAEIGPRRVSAFQAVAWFPAAAQGQVTIKNQLMVPALTFSTEFYAFWDAMVTCKHWLDHNICDVALVGAAETVGSPFLTAALGTNYANDAVVWFALAAHGDETIRIHCGSPPEIMSSDICEEGGNVRGSPILGACALPLLMLEARKNRPCSLRIPLRVLVHTNHQGLELWRLDL